MGLIERAKIELRENREGEEGFFTEDEIGYYIYEKHDGNFDKAMYEMCILKAENDSISLPGGLSLPDNANYWRNQAKKYVKVRFL